MDTATLNTGGASGDGDVWRNGSLLTVCQLFVEAFQSLLSSEEDFQLYSAADAALQCSGAVSRHERRRMRASSRLHRCAAVVASRSCVHVAL